MLSLLNFPINIAAMLYIYNIITIEHSYQQSSYVIHFTILSVLKRRESERGRSVGSSMLIIVITLYMPSASVVMYINTYLLSEFPSYVFS
jgi:hypothetical protein